MIAPPSARRIAWIDSGTLYLLGDDGKPKPHDSPFATQVTATAIQVAENRTNRYKGIFAGAVGGTPGAPPPTDRVHIRFSAVTRGFVPGEITYSLVADAFGGLLEYDRATGEEKRLFHREGFLASHIDRHPDTFALVCAVAGKAGTSHLVVMDGSAVDQRQATEGDSIDEAPSWVPGQRTRVVYQSSGVMRNRDGIPMGQGPSHIVEIDLATGHIETLIEEPNHDHLQPHRCADGTLLTIRRPWEPPGRSPFRPGALLLDIILFPFRVLRTVFHFLNVMSMVFSQRPLATSVGPPKPAADDKHLQLRGRVIDAQGALRKLDDENTSTPLVPLTWELIRRTPGHDTPQTIVRGIVAFDVATDDSIVYTNGRGIWIQLAGEPRPQLVSRGRVVEDVFFIE